MGSMAVTAVPMRRSWLGLLAGLLLGWLAGTPSLAEQVLPAGKAGDAPVVGAEAPQPAVWAVRDDDSTIYLFGTVHLRRAGASWGGPVARRAMDEADTVWLEVSPDDLAAERIGGVLREIGFDESRRLSTRLPPERLRQLRQAAVRMSLPAAMVETAKPWLLSSVLAMGPMRQAGYVVEAGVDRMVADAAIAAGKTVRGLESGEQQLRFLDGLPESAQLAMLYEALDHQDESVEVLRTAEAAWESGDQARLRQSLVEPMAAAYPELYEAIIDRRNHAWTQMLAEVMAGSGVDFVAIGAGHLGGEGSVDALLRERGFEVERLTPEPL